MKHRLLVGTRDGQFAAGQAQSGATLAAGLQGPADGGAPADGARVIGADPLAAGFPGELGIRPQAGDADGGAGGGQGFPLAGQFQIVLFHRV